MKLKFRKKLLGMAVTAAFATTGLAVVSPVHAALDANAKGDLAIVPYYTVKNDFVTAVHIVNSGEHTQVVKLRLRRKKDSADVLDFNIIMSPYDMWTGYVTKNDDGMIMRPTDRSCTAPKAQAGGPFGFFEVPNINNEDAEEGYIEVVGMAQTETEGELIALAAKHEADGIPLDCDSVRENFRAGNVTDNDTTTAFSRPAWADPNLSIISEYVDSDNDLKVSYFIRDNASGMEFGNNAVHIVNFMNEITGTGAHTGAMMTNQETGLSSGDLAGFDFPDLDGGGRNDVSDTLPTGDAALRGRYDSVIRADLGASSIFNDWSENTVTGATTDWIVTAPGQYLMVSPDPVRRFFFNDRDLPLEVTLAVYDREEGEAEENGGGLVVSPDLGPGKTIFENEVNLVQWGDQSIFESADTIEITSTGLNNPYGWAEMTTTPYGSRTQLIYDLTDQTGATSAAPTNEGVPIVGYAAWRRTFDTAEKNYGRIVEHSRKQTGP